MDKKKTTKPKDNTVSRKEFQFELQRIFSRIREIENRLGPTPSIH